MAKPIVFARVSPGDCKLVERACQARGENISVFVSRALRTELAKLSFLPGRDKKALGVPLSDAEPSTKGIAGCWGKKGRWPRSGSSCRGPWQSTSTDMLSEVIKIEIKRGHEEKSYSLTIGDFAGSSTAHDISMDEALGLIKEEMGNLREGEGE